MRSIAALVLCVLLFPLSEASAEFYRWVDRDGKEFFSNDRKQIPSEYRDRASVVRPDDGRVSVAEKGAVPAGRAAAKQASSGEHKDKYGRGEQYWRQKAGNLRLKLHKQQDEYDQVVKQFEEQDRRPKKTTSKKKTTSLDKKKQKLEKEIAQTTRMLEVDLPEEARKADAYPGWLRE